MSYWPWMTLDRKLADILISPHFLAKGRRPKSACSSPAHCNIETKRTLARADAHAAWMNPAICGVNPPKSANPGFVARTTRSHRF